MQEERRKAVRIKKFLTVRYSYGVSQEHRKWDMTVIRDISETGMSITTAQHFPPNEVLTFLIKIPSKPLEWIEFIGRVVGSEELKSASGGAFRGAHITRVEFINLKGTQKELIREYVTWFLSKEGGSQT